ncbi:MAG: mucoidy inhibitor MuiA family protein [Woeseia sp.]
MRTAKACNTFLGLTILVVASPAFAVDATSRIDAVTVYPSGAAITRIATVALPGGTTKVRLTGLVNNLDPNRIRVETGSGDVTIGQVRFARQQQREAFNADIERLNAEIREVESRIGAIDDAVKSAELRLKFLDGLTQGYAKEAWAGGARGTADVGSWREALSLLQTASADAYAEIRNQNAARTEAERDLSVLQRELAELSGGSMATSVVELSLRAPRALTTELRLHYFQNNARWMPQYEARLDSDTAELTLIQQAMVYQRTDEAWQDVSLSLSTSDPSGALEPGTLSSEFLDLRDPMPQAPQRAAMNKLQMANSDSVEEVAVTGARGVPAQIGNYAVTYTVPGRVSVANNADDAQALDLDSFDFDVGLVTRIMPRRSEQAYLAARFDYDRNVPLLGSTLRVYVDGAYAGMTTMPTVLPNAEITLPMGDDRRVEVNRVDRGASRGEQGLISRRNTETTDYLFEITNRRRSDTVVEVLDLYPVSRNEDITVDVPRSATTPTVTDVDDEPGVILWRKTLSPGEEWRIEHTYTVTWPTDKVLSRR